MESYTFEEGIAFLALAKAPQGVIRHLQKTHNRSNLHSEIHKMLRLPRTKEIIRKNNQSLVESTTARNPESTKEKNIEPKSDNIEPKSDTDNLVESTTARNPENTKEKNIEPNSDKTESNLSEIETSDDTPEVPNDGSTDIIITEDDVRSHKYTRLDQMPNELTRQLFLKKDESFHEMQQYHLKMRTLPEGEEHNEERAQYRAEVLRLDAEVDAYWQQIDAEIERFYAEQSRSPEVSQSRSPQFDISTYRAYISKALRKKELTPAQLAELQHRVDAMMAANVELKPETLDKLKAIGITVG